MSIGIGRERQFEVYVGGARGVHARVPVSFERLREAARGAMSPGGYAYVAGGAGREETMRENRAAFERWRIVPRVLRDVSTRDSSVEVLGTPLASPFVLCPIGVLEMAHGDADVAVARAAAAEGIPFVFSNQASRPMEETARAMGDAPRWFQLYWSTSNELVESLVARAERCGCSTIVLTLDTTDETDVTVSYLLRDVDGSADDAIQPVALQYRVGLSGAYTNLPAGFIADATTGGQATQVTPAPPPGAGRRRRCCPCRARSPPRSVRRAPQPPFCRG